MNYQKIYDSFIADRRAREADLLASGVYVERHHIVPRSMGGGDEPENIIALTAGDHFFAHLCLAKAHGGGYWAALFAMGKLSSRTHMRFRKFGIRRMVEIARIKALVLNNPSKRPDVARKKSLAMVGVPRYYARGDLHWTRNVPSSALSGVNNPNFGNRNSLETRTVMSKARKGLGTGNRNAMRRTEVAAKHSGENHWTKNPNNAAAYAKFRASLPKGAPRPQTTGSKNPKARAVRCVETGEVFDTCTAAAAATSVKHASSISSAARKNHLAGGYHWEYVS